MQELYTIDFDGNRTFVLPEMSIVICKTGFKTYAALYRQKPVQGVKQHQHWTGLRAELLAKGHGNFIVRHESCEVYQQA